MLARFSSPSVRRGSAFSLVEVMIALAIFFMCAFSILVLVSTVIKNARILQTKKGVNAGLVAANYYALSNKLDEVVETGDFADMYPGYSWTADTYEVSSNGFFQVDMVIQHSGGQVESQMSILLFKPESKPGSMSGGRRP